MTEIAPLNTNGCLQRGISIMRLVLGYLKGLPDDWKITEGCTKGKYTILDEVQHVIQSFPRHHVTIICSDKFAESAELKPNQYVTEIKNDTEKFGNDHIFAFSYMHNAYGHCHFLLGNPIQDMEPYTMYAVVVSIKEKGNAK